MTQPTIALQIQGMSCASCVAQVEKKLLALTGVSHVVVDLSQQVALVIYDPYQTAPIEWVAPMERLGYPISFPNDS